MMSVTGRVKAPLGTPAHVTPAARALGRLCVFVGVASATISGVGSWVPSLWGDEAASVMSATRPVGSLGRMLAHVDAVHGAYYVGLHAWVGIFGSSPFAVRFPSAVAVGVCAAATVWLCGRFGSLRFAAVAGLFVAVLPRMTYAGEEARSYAFDAALGVVFCVVLAEMILRRRVSPGWWVVYAGVLALGICLFVYFALMIAVAVAVVVASPSLRQQWRRALVATGLALAASSPVIAFAVLQRSQIGYLAHRDTVNPNDVLVQMWFGAIPFALIAWGLILLAGAMWIAEEVRRRRRRQSWRPTLESIVVPWLVLPMGILIATSPVAAGYTARYGTFAAPAAGVLMALGVRRLAQRWWAACVALAAVMVAVGPVWSAQRTPYAKNGSDWNDISASIQSRAIPGDAVVFDEGVRPSRRPRLAMDTNPEAFAGISSPTLKTPYAQGATWHDTTLPVADAVRLGRFSGIDRVWVVEYAIGESSDTWGIAELRRAGYRQVDRLVEHRSVVYLFER